MAGSPSPKKEHLDLLAGFLKFSPVFVIDPIEISRKRTIDMLKMLGALGENLHEFSEGKVAYDKFATVRPAIVLTDYQLNDSTGLDLINQLRAAPLAPGQTPPLFGFVTSTSSHAVISLCAEADLDTFILKPFSDDSFTESLLFAALDRLAPTQYALKLEAGKKALSEQKIDEALGYFEEAESLDPKPTLACYFHGFVQTKRGQIKSAEASFRRGLHHDNSNFRCLDALFNLLSTADRNSEAYGVLRHICRLFPSNPMRLAQLVYLAVKTENFPDIDQFYQFFAKADLSNPHLLKHVCAGLLVCGKYFLKRNQLAKCLTIFTKVATSSKADPKYIQKIVEALDSYQYVNEANRFREFLSLKQAA